MFSTISRLSASFSLKILIYFQHMLGIVRIHYFSWLLYIIFSPVMILCLTISINYISVLWKQIFIKFTDILCKSFLLTLVSFVCHWNKKNFLLHYICYEFSSDLSLFKVIVSKPTIVILDLSVTYRQLLILFWYFL